MSAVLLVLILLGVAGVGFYFFSRSRAMEGEDALLSEDGTVRRLESERRDSRALDRLQLDDMIAFDGGDYIIRGILTYQTEASDEAMEPRAVEYLLELDDGADEPDERHQRWLWVEARGDVALEVRRRASLDDIDADFDFEIKSGEEPDADDAPENLDWSDTTYTLRDAEWTDRTGQGHTPDRATGRCLYFHYVGAGDEVLFVERIRDQLRAFEGRAVAEYELEVLPS